MHQAPQSITRPATFAKRGFRGMCPAPRVHASAGVTVKGKGGITNCGGAAAPAPAPASMAEGGKGGAG